MLKEFVICVIIVTLIFVGNIITQNYTNSSIDITSENLNKLREEIIKEQVNLEISNQKIKEISSDWNSRHKNLAYYIEHDELEKVETDLSALKGYIEVEEYKEATAELDRTIYILQHIKNKNIFNLENIF